MTLGYLIRRLGVFLLIIWVTATINFVVPRLGPGDPVEAAVARMMRQGASIEGTDKLIAEYRKMFGLDDPLPVQYVRYLQSMASLNMGYSLTLFPLSAWEIVAQALPYTIGLVAVSTLLAFVLGVTVGAVLAWRGTPRALRAAMSLFIAIAPFPYYLLALIFLFLFAFTLQWFPAGGTSEIGQVYSGAFDLAQLLDILNHSILPAGTIVISSIGGWALGMRGMMVTVQGEDYLTLAEAMGLKRTYILFRYAIRNAILPQVTGLAIALGHVVSGATLVEMIFGYPGMGYRLYLAISNADFTVMQGITFIIVLTLATAILLIDLLYPKLDPRITYGRR